MNDEMSKLFKQITLPAHDSHKGQNGRLLIIGGSKLFHAASLWSLTVASRIVDLVHYCSTPENNEIVKHAKEEFRNGIVVSEKDIDAYIQEDDCILIGNGMTRDDQTKKITNSLLKKYPEKQWVIDAGSLQMVDLVNIPRNAILTPHKGELERMMSNVQCSMFNVQSNLNDLNSKQIQEVVQKLAEKLQCIILLKGEVDIASNGSETKKIQGGNAGMTKGGTGDVLAGLIAGLACTNDPWISTVVGSYINKKAGDELYASVGPFFNSSDLANQIPKTMKKLLL